MATINFNIPVLSIPFYYILSVFPHYFALARAHKRPGDMQKYDNSNAKGSKSVESLKKRLTAKELAAFERAEACHRNNLENMSLYVATIFAGMLAEQRAGEDEVGLIGFVFGWNIIRILFTINYMNVETNAWSYVRSLLYFMGLGWSFVMLWKASIIMGT